MPAHAVGTLLAIVTAVMWSMSALCFEAAGRRIGSLPVNVLRLSVAVLLLAAVVLVRSSMALLSGTPADTVFWLIVSGLIGFTLCDLCLFRAYVLIGARQSTLVLALAPVFASVLDAVAVRRPPSMIQGLGIAVTLAGVLWVIAERPNDEAPHDGRQRRLGVILALIAAVTQALGAAAAKIGMRLPDGAQYDPIAATLIRATAGLIGFTLLVVVSGRIKAVFRGVRDGRAMGILTLGAAVGPVIGVVCFMASLQHVPSGVTQTVTATIPVILLPVAILRGREHVSPRAVFGAVVAVGGVVILCLF